MNSIGAYGMYARALTDTQRVLLHGGAVLFNQIPLVYHDDARLTGVVRLSGHLGVLLGNTFGRVNHDNAYIGALYRQQRTHNREFLDLLVHLALLTDTGGVDERKLAVRVVHIGINTVAGRTGDVGDNNTLLTEHAG